MIWPSVTQVLHSRGYYRQYEQPWITWVKDKDGNPIDPRTRGSYVDEACNLMVLGRGVNADWLLRHPECEPFIDAYRKFLHEHKVRVIRVPGGEVRNEKERYTGHPDQILWLDGDPTLLSVKTGKVPHFWKMQEAGYYLALFSQTSAANSAQERELPALRYRTAIELRNDGTYRLEGYREFFDPRELDEWRILIRAYWIDLRYMQ